MNHALAIFVLNSFDLTEAAQNALSLPSVSSSP
jgi:hypothetical protein